MTFEDAKFFSRILTFSQIANRLFLCVNNKNGRVAYFYLSVMYLKSFNVGVPANRIIHWKSAIKAYKRYKTPR